LANVRLTFKLMSIDVHTLEAGKLVREVSAVDATVASRCARPTP
jgi:hypothetical protein